MFLLTATEQPAGYMRVSHTLNALISGELLQVERKFRGPFTLVPRCKIAWAMNELPRLKSTSDGLLRRVKVIELDPIPEEERDPEAKNKVREEGPGILTWALEGQRRVTKRGSNRLVCTPRSGQVQGMLDRVFGLLERMVTRRVVL
jgi:putative DNA primase/helicase